jgi:hypothetical protein
VPRLDFGWLPPPEICGQWQGDCAIRVDFTRQRRLPISLNIAPDGTATGHVGDATLVDAQVHADRNDIERQLHIARDYVVIGKLDGPVIATERIAREQVVIPFNLDDGDLTGGLTPKSSWFAGEDIKDVTAGEMVLKPTGSNDAATQPLQATP